MPKNMDKKSKGLLWFLFQPEDSSEIIKIKMNSSRAAQSQAPMDMFPEALKSAVWISVSILLSLTLAHLN
jgi:hypothetical protein